MNLAIAGTVRAGQPTLTDRQFVNIRCSADGRTHYFTATGAMYAHPTDRDAPAHLFEFMGVDVSRCLHDESSDRWFLVSRKFSLYLDPQTGEMLHQWRNPWTGETLNVMHRSYDYQEFPIPPQMPLHHAPAVSSVSLDFNLKIPNPLAGNPKFADYSPEPFVQSSDSYKFIFPTRLLHADAPQPDDEFAVALSYYRMGPWEPWMKMGGKPGFLVLNYTGSKTDRFSDLPALIQNYIETRMPLYREAPTARLDRSIATSWTRFDEEFDAYLRGETFPLPAPLKSETAL